MSRFLISPCAAKHAEAAAWSTERIDGRDKKGFAKLGLASRDKTAEGLWEDMVREGGCLHGRGLTARVTA